MLKRLCLALAGLFVLVNVAYGAGTVPGFSLVPQFDLSGKIAPGCKLYVIQAGTVSTPQNAYQDSGLTLLQPNPMTCDAAGRLPQWFVADGNIKLRLTDKNGVQIFVQDGLLVVGASSGGGGGSPVDPTTVLTSCDMKVAYGTSVLSGFVRANGRTIGNATSGATERANADTSALFACLYNADANLVVSGGRGASAAADFAANKTIALPDMRGRAMAGLDDMGNTAAGVLTGTNFGVTPTVLGAKGGAESHSVAQANLPNVSLSSASLSVAMVNADLVHRGSTAGMTYASGTGGTLTVRPIDLTISTLSASISGTVPLGGSGTALPTVSPLILMTIYIKL